MNRREVLKGIGITLCGLLFEIVPKAGPPSFLSWSPMPDPCDRIEDYDEAQAQTCSAWIESEPVNFESILAARGEILMNDRLQLWPEFLIVSPHLLDEARAVLDSCQCSFQVHVEEPPCSFRHTV
jgi:hypothetical protein